jgi:hypothetical protein
MAYEPSEIAFALAMQYTNKQLKTYTQDSGGIKKLIVESKQKLKATKKIKFGNSAIDQGFTSLINEKNNEFLKDMAGGISAAIGFRSWIKNENFIPTSYMTGNVWPEEVKKFRVSAYGFEDYNSADVILSANNKNFYGVSLKKKRKVNAGEPTLINKAFDTILQGKKFDTVKEELVKARINYFADLVIEAVKKGIILKSHIKGFDSLKISATGKKELFEAKQRDKKLFDRSYIDTKGSVKQKDGYLDDDTKNPNSMRYFVNKKLAEKDNPLWKEFISVMNKHAEIFAESLINIILKTKLYEELDVKELKKYDFNFALITGVGDITTKGAVDIGEASVIPLKTTLCGLGRINKIMEGKPYKIVLDNSKKAGSDAAKIFLQLKKGTITLLDLEIRYKGAFTPQPQFQGTLNTEFKDLLIKECGFKD